MDWPTWECTQTPGRKPNLRSGPYLADIRNSRRALDRASFEEGSAGCVSTYLPRRAYLGALQVGSFAVEDNQLLRGHSVCSLLNHICALSEISDLREREMELGTT